MGDAVTFILTRILPSREEKTSTVEHPRKGLAAKQAARAHHDNLLHGHTEMDEVYDALMRVLPGETVGPFDGYCYRIDKEQK